MLGCWRDTLHLVKKVRVPLVLKPGSKLDSMEMSATKQARHLQRRLLYLRPLQSSLPLLFEKTEHAQSCPNCHVFLILFFSYNVF